MKYSWMMGALGAILAATLPGMAEARYHGDRGFVAFSVGVPAYGYSGYPYYDPYYAPPPPAYYNAPPPGYYNPPPPAGYYPPPPVEEQGYNEPPQDNGDDRYCREYQSNVRVAGRVKETYGTACMQPDGSWEKVN